MISGENYRDFIRYQGIRVVFKVEGEGNTVSVASIIL
jgi:hypothetical protein